MFSERCTYLYYRNLFIFSAKYDFFGFLNINFIYEKKWKKPINEMGIE